MSVDGYEGYLGPALMIGFLVMFLMDQGSSHVHSPAHGHGHGAHGLHAHAVEAGVAGGSGVGGSGADHGSGAAGGGSGGGSGGGAAGGSGPGELPFFTSTFVGLLVHNVADGMAMGAAAAGTNKELETLVFLAIVMHKAPAAFALCTVLLAEARSRSVRGARRGGTRSGLWEGPDGNGARPPVRYWAVSFIDLGARRWAPRVGPTDRPFAS